MKGALRIRYDEKRFSFASSKSPKRADDYLSRLVKLIPSEVLTIYVMAENLIPEDNLWALGIFTVICFGLIVIIRGNATKEIDGKKTQWMAVFISLVSFFIWIYTAGKFFVMLKWHVPWLGTLSMAVWILIVPYFYKGEKVK